VGSLAYDNVIYCATAILQVHQLQEPALSYVVLQPFAVRMAVAADFHQILSVACKTIRAATPQALVHCFRVYLSLCPGGPHLD
jgi:hypothetical protein